LAIRLNRPCLWLFGAREYSARAKNAKPCKRKRDPCQGAADDENFENWAIQKPGSRLNSAFHHSVSLNFHDSTP
jgi:hypothetical protein